MTGQPCPPRRLAPAARATSVAFVGAGFAFASWASRIPQVRDQLHLSPGDLGLLLLAIAAGSMVALPLSGTIIAVLGTRRTVAAMAALLALALASVGVGYLIGVAPVAIGLFVLGFANGGWDVAMNVQGADVERRLGHPIMPRFHAAFSLGSVAGALIGAVMVALGVPVAAHLAGVAAVVLLVVPVSVRRFLPDPAHEPSTDTASTSAALARWREPRTVLIGVFVLAFAFSEGTGNDWISVALIDGYHAPAVVGTLGFAVFLAAMTAARWIGPGLLARYGRVRAVRTLAVVAVVGLLLFVFGPNTSVAFAGAVLWGAGTSLGFPVGMSAAADVPAAAAGRVSVVASIGYCAFLGGAPLIGFLGSHVDILKALCAVAAVLAAAFVIASAVQPVTSTVARTDAASRTGA